MHFPAIRIEVSHSSNNYNYKSIRVILLLLSRLLYALLCRSILTEMISWTGIVVAFESRI